LEISQQNPPARAGRSLEDLLAALAEAISVFVARLAEPYPGETCPQRSAAPGTPRAASPPNRDYF
jgi:hypothetical protein